MQASSSISTGSHSLALSPSSSRCNSFLIFIQPSVPSPHCVLSFWVKPRFFTISGQQFTDPPTVIRVHSTLRLNLPCHFCHGLHPLHLPHLFWHSESWTPRNEALMEAVAKQVRTTRHPWLTACDANMCPEDFKESLWFYSRHMFIEAPSSCRSKGPSGELRGRTTMFSPVTVCKERSNVRRWWKISNPDPTQGGHFLGRRRKKVSGVA